MKGNLTIEERVRRIEATGIHVSDLMRHDLEVLAAIQEDTEYEMNKKRMEG